MKGGLDGNICGACGRRRSSAILILMVKGSEEGIDRIL